MPDNNARNPLRDPRDRRLVRVAAPSALVLFGVTGDLAKKKLLPAMYDLARTGQAEVSWFLHGGTPAAQRDQMVQAFQTIISRNKKPVDAGVISVTMIHAGEATNVVPDSCELQGTVRSLEVSVEELRAAGKRIVCVLPDSGERYVSTPFFAP